MEEEVGREVEDFNTDDSLQRQATYVISLSNGTVSPLFLMSILIEAIIL